MLQREAWTCSLLVFWLDRRADVDGGQGSEDKCLDADDNDHFEEIEDHCERHDEGKGERLEDEDQPQKGKDQDVSREHVREEPDAQRDQAHELTQDLERDDQAQEWLRRLRDPALEVAHGAVPTDAFEISKDESQ